MDIIFGAEALQGSLTGVGTYANELLRGLQTDPRIHTVRCFADNVWLPDTLQQTAPQRSLTKKLVNRFSRLIPSVRTWEQRQSNRIARILLNESAACLYHEPNFILRPFDGPSIATIHDLSFLRNPDFHPRRRVEYLTRGLGDTIARASCLLTVSETVRAEMIEQLGVAPERVIAIHNGVGAAYHPMDPAELEPILRSYQLEAGCYLLAVGTIEPRKNLAALLDAYEGLSAALRKRFPLVVAGSKGWHNSSLVSRLKALEARGVLRSLGYVPAQDLPALYAGARGFAFPSLYEGFGLPVLEAAACGVPVLSSSGTAMAEVLGSQGLLVEPRDPDALRDGLRHLLEDDELHLSARASASNFSKRFSWQDCIARTVEIYQQVMLKA